MEYEIEKMKGITPEIAREICQESADWESRVQAQLDKEVPPCCLANERRCRLSFPKGDAPYTGRTVDIVVDILRQKGWGVPKRPDPDLWGGDLVVEVEW